MFYPNINTQNEFELRPNEMLLGIKVGNKHCQVCSFYSELADTRDLPFIQFATSAHLGSSGGLYFGPTNGIEFTHSFYSILRAFAFSPDTGLSLANICREKLNSIGMQSEDLLTTLFEEIIRRAEINWNKRVVGAVIGVPDYLDHEHLQKWKDVIVRSGLKDYYLIPNDGASIMEFRRLQKERELTKPVLFFRFGDAHCTVTLVKYYGNQVKIIAKKVNTQLGVRVLNTNILKYWKAINNLDLNHFEKNPKLFESAMLVSYEVQEQIERQFLFKKILDGPINAQISLETYHELIEPEIAKITGWIRLILEENSLSPDDIGDVVMMGGASSISMIQIALSRLCSLAKPHLLGRYPMAAKGAAVLAKSFVR